MNGKLVVTGAADTKLSPRTEGRGRRRTARTSRRRPGARDHDQGFRQRGQRPATSRGQGGVRPGPVSPTSGSSPWPRPSAISTRGSTPAKATCRRGWGGFHWIEQALWVDNTTDGLCGEHGWSHRRMSSSSQNLIPRTSSSSRPASPTARSSCSTRCRRRRSPAEEERYSRTDLVDFEANVAGRAGGVRRGEAVLAAKNAALATHRRQVRGRRPPRSRPTTGTAFVAYTDLSADTKALAQVDRHAGRAALEGCEEGRRERERARHGPRLARRRFLGSVGALAAPRLRERRRQRRRLGAPAAVPQRPSAVVPFHGAHQAGIVTAAQDRLLFASFDVLTDAETTSSPAPGVDERGAPHDRRASRSAPTTPTRTRRPTTPAKPSASGPPRSRSRSVSGPAVRARRVDPFGIIARSPRRWSTMPTFARRRASTPPAATATSWCRRAPTTPRVLPRHPQPRPHRSGRRRSALVADRASAAPRAPTPRRRRRGTSWGSRTAPTTSSPKTPPR